MNEEELKALLDKYKHFNFVKRMLDKSSPKIDNGDGTFSTHKMETSEADGKHYAYPTIVQDKNGKLIDLSKLGKNAAWEYAVKTGEMIPFDKAEQADEFSKHEGQQYQKYYGMAKLTQEEFNSKLQELYAKAPTMSPEEASKEFMTLQADNPNPQASDYANFISMFPQSGSHIVEMQKQVEAGKLKGKVAAGFQVAADLGMTAASIAQIAMSNSAVRNLQNQRPGLAAVPGYNPQLTQALYEAGRGVNNPNVVLDPAKQQIQQAYLAQLQSNQGATGGQAGALQGLNQVANLQRMQAALGLAPLAQDVISQNNANRNNLLNMRLGETQNMFQNQAHNAEQAYNQYYNQAKAAGMVGSSGRTNLMDSMQRLASHIPDTFNYFDPETNALMKDTHIKTAMNHARQFQYPDFNMYNPDPSRFMNGYQNKEIKLK